MNRSGKPGHQLRDRAAGRVDLDRHRDGVAVVLHQEDHRQLEVGGGVERLPELALAGGAVAGGAEHDLVAVRLLVPVGDALDAGVAEPCLRAAHGLEELGAGGARRADDVEGLVAPMGRHLPAARVGIVGGADGGQELLRGRHAEAETERAIAVVGVEPVVGGAEDPRGGHQDALVAGARDLEEDLVLPLELDLLVVDPPRQQHEAVHVEQVRLLQLGGRAGAGGGTCGHRTRGRGSRSPAAWNDGR